MAKPRAYPTTRDRGGCGEVVDSTPMLSPYRVLDLTDERGFLAGKILAELGADVVKVEPPGGDPARHAPPYLHGEPGPERSLRWLAMNTSKRSVVIDLDVPSGLERLLRLVSEADVLIEGGTLRLDWDALRERNPALIYCTVTPFGRTGPYSGFRAHDLGIVAMGGNASMTGEAGGPPMRCSAPTSYFHAAPEAALGILMALHARRRTGRGQLVDVSMQECQLRTLLSGAAQFALTGRLGRRSGGHLGRTREIWQAADGQVSFGLRGGAARIPNLIATVTYMKECDMAPGWLQDFDWQNYSPISVSDDDLARIEDTFAAFFATKTMGELYDQALSRRILLAPCNDARAILEQVQLRSRDLFREIDGIAYPDFFAKASRSRIGIRSRAPRLGEHDDAPWAGEARERTDSPEPDGEKTRAFDGLRVLELGAGAAGPVATSYFAEHGATVIRIESAARPDFLRMLHVTAANRDDPGILEKAPMFVLLNPDKQSLTLNMKEPEAVEIVKRLAAWADVVSENFAPGVMEKWGLAPAELREQNRRLIVVSGCLFGQTGPQRTYPGFGGQGAAISGFNHLTGREDGDAHGPYATITDSLAPRYVATAIAAALLERERSGEGQIIDVSQIETGVYSLSQVIARFSANGEVETRRGNRSEWTRPHGVYPCAGEDRWIAIGVFSDEEWEALQRAIGEPLDRDQPEDELDARIAEWTRTRDAYELMHSLQAAGVEACAVQNFEDLQTDPQLAHRGHFVDADHAYLGSVRLERSAFRLSETPGSVAVPGPLLGEHNRDILSGLVGYSDGDIDQLIERKVVA